MKLLPMLGIIGLGLITFGKKMIPMNVRTVKDIYGELASKFAMIWNVDKNLILAIIMQESRGIPSAIGTSGEVGLMQIMKGGALADYNNTFKTSYGSLDLFTPAFNIEVGSWYISHLMKQYKLSTFDALRAYNGGIGNILKGNSSISVSYAESVLKYQQQLKEGV